MKLSSLILGLCSAVQGTSWTPKESVKSLGWDLLFSNDKINSENTVVSPLSVVSAMYMLAAGTKGTSQYEILKALQAEGNENIFDEYTSFVSNIIHDNEKEYTLQLANAAFYQHPFGNSNLHAFTESLTGNFIRDSENIRPVDFEKDSEKATEEINNWVSDKTHGKIDKIFDTTLDSTTLVVLANALYYKATWKQAFLAEKSYQIWSNTNGMYDDVKYMYSSARFHQGVVNGVVNGVMKVLEIPMIGKEYNHFDMAIWYMDGKKILDETEEDIQKTIRDNFFTYRRTMKKSNVRLMMPKMSIGSSYNMVDQFKEMGIKAVFDGPADFSPMFGHEVDAQVGKINHKVQLDIDEKGIEGAAATAIVINYRSSSIPTRIDITSPFYFSISNRCYNERKGNCVGNIPIFVGKVVKP